MPCARTVQFHFNCRRQNALLELDKMASVFFRFAPCPPRTDVGLARPKNITRIECYGTSIHGGENTPVWLGPSTFDNPYPVHVHRHLGIITSRFLKELGRPMELFCRTGLLPGTTATLIAPDET